MVEVLLKAGAYILIIVLGYTLKKAGFFKKDDYKIIMKIALNITLPAAVLHNFATFDFNIALLYCTGIALLMNFILLGIGFAITRKKDDSTKALYMVNFPSYNIGSFTMPYVQGFLGPMGVVCTCLFDCGNAVMCTGGIYAMTSRYLGGKGQGVKETLKKLLTTPFCSYLIMLAVSMIGIKIPDALLTLTRPIANANPFVAMLMVGTMFEFNPNRQFLRKAVTIVLVRYIMGTAFAVAFWLLPFPLEVRQVLTIIAFAPCSAMSPAFTEKLGSDHELASFTGSVTILLSIITITTLIAVMGL